MTQHINKRPLIIGLTGSIGMGKSTVAKMFVEAGVPLFDADAAVHELQGPNGSLVGEIEQLFPGTTSETGVDRQKLGAAVLGNADALHRLEGLIHPAVGQMRKAFFEAHHEEPLLLFDIPLLFEKNGSADIDHIVVVSASEEDQLERVLSRAGMTLDKFDKIKSLQMPDKEKRERADSIIDTSCPISETRGQVQNLVQKLKASLA